MSNYSYVGKGVVWVGLPSAKLRNVSNASSLTIGVSESTAELLNYQDTAGGQDDFVSRIQEVTIAATLHDISPENLALALFGGVTEVTANTVTDESHTAHLGGLVRFDNLPDPDQPITVTNSGATTTYVAGTDYEVSAAGVRILEGGAVPDASAVLVDYDKRPGHVVQALVSASGQYRMVFEGLNEAKSGRPFVIDVHRVRLSPAENIALIGDEFAGLEISGRVVRDDSIVGSALSKYFKAELAA